MAVAIQANLVQLRVAQARQAGIAVADHPIRTPSPGGVRRFRETLIDRSTIKDYDDAELLLRLREIWGQFSLFCWAVHAADPNDPPDFSDLPAGMYLRPPRELGHKMRDIERTLWRFQHEQRLRGDPAAARDPRFRAAYEAALDIPTMVYGENVRVCSDGDLLMCACEFVGMLRAIRWIADDRLTWDHPAIVEVGLPAGRSP